MTDPCVFCRIIAGEIPAAIVHRDARVVAFRDRAPSAPHHIIVVPVVHIADLSAVFLPRQLGTLAERLLASEGAQATRDGYAPEPEAALFSRPPSTVNAAIDAGRILHDVMGVAAALGATFKEPAGFRLVINTGAAAGQTVPHLHIHVLGGEPLGAMNEGAYDEDPACSECGSPDMSGQNPRHVACSLCAFQRDGFPWPCADEPSADE